MKNRNKKLSHPTKHNTLIILNLLILPPQKQVHRIIALVSSYNPSKINSKYFSSLNPYAFLFIIFILLFIPSTLALDIW